VDQETVLSQTIRPEKEIRLDESGVRDVPMTGCWADPVKPTRPGRCLRIV